MKKTKRLSALFTALLLLVCFAAGCAAPDESQQTTPAVTDARDTPGEETPAPVTADPDYTAELPAGLNYNNREISILATGQSFSVDEFDADKLNGEIVNDAVYKRNTEVEELLGVRFKVTVADVSSVYAVGDTVRASVSAGDKSYDISTMPGYTHTTYVLEGNYYNLLDIENLDLGKYYWTQGFNDIMSNGTKQYVASGAYSLSMYRNMYITLYNKDIFNANGLEDLYPIVERGEWTIGRQSEMVSGLYSDLNGSGTRDVGDFYGLAGGANTSVDPYWVGFKMPFMSLSDGIYTVDLNTERLSNIVDTLQTLLFENEGVLCIGKTSAEDSAYSTNIISEFNDGHAAMCTTMVFQLENFLTPSNFESDYGIAPIPKFDDNQEEYYTHVQDQLSVVSVVSTVSASDLPMIGAVLEAIASESYKYVYDAYYKTALSYRYLQNSESVVMLDLIYRSVRIEGAFIYSAKFAMLGTLRSIIASGTNRLASTAKAYSKTWGNAARGLNEALEKLSH